MAERTDRTAGAPRREVDFATVTETPGTAALPETLDALRTRYELASRLAAGGDVLEVGCGPGMGLGYLQRRCRQVVGGEYDAGLVRRARAHYGARLPLCRLDAGVLPFVDAAFDLVLLLEAVYYLPEPARFVAEARRVLRPGGALLICSANCERPDFNPSPHTFSYLGAAALGDLLRAEGFAVELAAAFPAAEPGPTAGLYRLLRATAVKLRLIPRTMAGKERLKRLLYRGLRPLPAELTDEGRATPLVAVGPGTPVTGYKVVYATGRLPAASASR